LAKKAIIRDALQKSFALIMTRCSVTLP